MQTTTPMEVPNKEPEDTIDPRELSQQEITECNHMLNQMPTWKPHHVLYLVARRRMLDRLAWQGKVEALISVHVWARQEWKETHPEEPIP